jgi:hypothetical protein
MRPVVQQPNLLSSYFIALASLLAGATFVHRLYRPDLVGLRQSLVKKGSQAAV